MLRNLTWHSCGHTHSCFALSKTLTPEPKKSSLSSFTWFRLSYRRAKYQARTDVNETLGVLQGNIA